MEDRARIERYLGEIMRRIVASLAMLILAPGLASAQLNPLSYAPLDSGQGLSPILSGTVAASIVTTATTGTFTYGTTVYNAVMTPQVGGPDIAVFTFTNINLGGLATALSISGTNPVAILSHQNITMLPVGINGNSGAAAAGGAGGVGASAGGAKGVAGGGANGGGVGTSGGGAGNAGAGGNGAGVGAGAGGAVNATNLLIGGSGGGGSSFGGGGGGGGALEIGAVNTISFSGSTPITANGGAAASGTGVGGTAQGGGGAGGLVYIHGKQVTALATQTFSVNGGNAPNLNGGGGGGGKLIIDGLQAADPNSPGTPIEPTFVGANFQAAGGQASNGVDGGAGEIVMAPSLPIVTNYNVVLNGLPITLNGVGANLGTRLSYVVNRDLQVGTNVTGAQPGVARLGANEPLASNAKLSIEASGVFQTSTFKQTVAKLSGTGVLQLDATGTLAVGSASTVDLDFNGEIVGLGTLEKAGSGTLIRSLNLELPGTFRNTAGTLAIDGATIKADTAFHNAAGAEIQLLGLGGSIVSPVFTNLGRVVGSGDVEADLDNQPGGTIRLMEGASQRYLGALNNNEGVISLLGGTVEFANPVTNVATTGGITGRGTVIVGGAGLTNDGFLAFSGGNTDFIGDVTNTATGQASTVGGATTSYYGDFVNNGTVLTATGSTTVFLGPQSGGGSFTGGGTVEYFGAIIPGNSPALISYGGDVVFGPASTLKIELGGTVRGSMYDALNIAGNLATENALEVSLINGFVPSIGQTFDILNWGSLTGQFASLSLPSLSGAAWDTSQLYVNGTLKVVAPGGSGDFDGNGVVDSGDLNGWKGGFGTNGSATRQQGDADGDGDVDGADFLAWQRGVGQSGSTPVAASVPEPCSALLMLAALARVWTLGKKR
jgi:hypothetical protein